MRLWSLHPSLLDRIGLVALWREALRAQKVLVGATQKAIAITRSSNDFESGKPVRTIANYLWSIADEAEERGYHFDSMSRKLRWRVERLPSRSPGDSLPGSSSSSNRNCAAGTQMRVKANPTFKVVEGPIEPWERTAGPKIRRIAVRLKKRG